MFEAHSCHGTLVLACSSEFVEQLISHVTTESGLGILHAQFDLPAVPMEQRLGVDVKEGFEKFISTYWFGALVVRGGFSDLAHGL